MTRLGDSVARVQRLLAENLTSSDIAEQLLAETTARRAIDLSDLGPEEQTALVSGRAVDVLPSVDSLREAIKSARAQGRPLTVKLGIDPTSADVHLGHAVPVIILSRFQRMGHHVVLIIGDITAKIGDPSGRSTDRPTLTDEEIASNLATYRHQLSPFFDFRQADFRHNSEWLTEIRLPEMIEILAKISGVHVAATGGFSHPPHRGSGPVDVGIHILGCHGYRLSQDRCRPGTRRR